MGFIDTLRYYLGVNPPAQKGLYDLHPELRDRQHLGTFTSGAETVPTPYTYLAAIQDYKSYPWVYKAISVIANNVAQLPLIVRRGDDVVEAHPLAQLFAAVNDAMSSADLWRWWTVDMMLAGESAFEFVKSRRGTYVEVWPRQPNTVAVRVSEQGKRYMKIDGFTVDDGQGDPYKLPPDEMLLFKLYNPSQPFRGLAPISAARTSVDTDKAAAKWNLDFYRRSARPDYAITTPQGTTRSEREQLLREVESQYTGQAGKPIVLEEGVTDIKTLSFPPKDMAWLDQREFAREEVGSIFGVPDEIMGWGRDTYENFKTAQQVFWDLTLKPLLAIRDIALNEWGRRVGALKLNEEIYTDLSSVPELQRKPSEIFAYHIDAGIVSRDDVRESLGLSVDQDSPDRMLYDMKRKVQLMEQAINVGYSPELAARLIGLPQPDSIPPSLIGAFAFGAAGEIVEAADDEPAQLAAPVQIAKAEAADAEVKLIVPKGQAVEFGGELHRALYSEFIKRTSPHEARIGRAVAKMMRDLERDVLARLRSGAKSIADVDEEPFDREEWQRQFARRIRPEHRRTMREAGERALRDVGVGVRFDLLNPRVVAFLRERAQRFAVAVAETTWNQLKTTIAEGIEAGETIDEIAARIEATMELRINQSSTTIARTETISAFNAGATEGWRQSGVVESKQWLSTLDDRTRTPDNGDEFDHVSCNGEIVPLDEPFTETGEDLQYPGDSAGSAGNVINCRCTSAAIVEP